MFRTGVRTALLAFVIATMQIVPAPARFSQGFPGKGSRQAWENSVQISKQAYAAEDRGDYKTAETLYRKVIQVYPYDAIAYYDLGLFLNHRKRYREAEPLLRKSIQLNPEFGNWHQLGVSLTRQGRLPEAEQAFRSTERFAQSDKERQVLRQDEDAVSSAISAGAK